MRLENSRVHNRSKSQNYSMNIYRENRIKNATILIVAIFQLVVWPIHLSKASEFQIQFGVETRAQKNIYTPREDIVLHVNVDPKIKNKILYHWQDFHGDKLTSSVPLPDDNPLLIAAPKYPPRYLGLVLTPTTPDSALPNRRPGEMREYGFSILPERTSVVNEFNPDSWFGIVHGDIYDPYLRGWIKTLTWKTTRPKWWLRETNKRKRRGLVELPIITGSAWKSSDNLAITTDQLTKLDNRIYQFFSANPNIIYWETGIEENLKGRYKSRYYLTNLSSKARIVRAAADRINPNIKLVYQIANIRPNDVEIFLQSDAAKYYDVISLHPYNWPNFPDPEKWLASFLEEVRLIMAKNGFDLPIWFTEVGAPQNDNHPGEFFGYPRTNKKV